MHTLTHHEKAHNAKLGGRSTTVEKRDRFSIASILALDGIMSHKVLGNSPSKRGIGELDRYYARRLDARFTC